MNVSLPRACGALGLSGVSRWAWVRRITERFDNARSMGLRCAAEPEPIETPKFTEAGQLWTHARAERWLSSDCTAPPR